MIIRYRHFKSFFFYLCVFGLVALASDKAHAKSAFKKAMLFQQPVDTTVDSATLVKIMKRLDRYGKNLGIEDSISVTEARKQPFVSVQQYVKGNIAGVYVQESNGEPGVIQNMVIHGLSAPVFSNADIQAVQPAFYLNGIPLIQEHPYAYDVQEYNLNRIGPGFNLLAGVNINNVQSIEVIKDPVQLAKLGPMAANGAVWITTKNAASGYRKISIDTYFGMVSPEHVSTTNASYENQFRRQFYSLYATTPQEERAYPAFLADVTNADYYGPSAWDDLYYQRNPLYNVNFAFASGSKRSNFRFVLGQTKDAGNADNTSFTKSNAAFYINMAPFTWWNISSMINGSRITRNPNRNLRDRFMETQYLPDLTTPISPSKNEYQLYLDEFDKAIDDNLAHSIQGYISLDFNYRMLTFSSRVNFDYNENIRDIFWPTTVGETVNYASNYFSYNQRAIWSNTLKGNFYINEDHAVNAELGMGFQDDVHQYNYAKGYNGPNDYIKVSSGSSGDTKYSVFTYTDKERLRLFSLYGSINYTFRKKLTINAVLRGDGASSAQRDSRWLVEPALSANWNILDKLSEPALLNNLSAGLSWARIGRLFTSDRLGQGPQYSSDLSWAESPGLPSYNSIAGVTRSYSTGWIGYGLSWPYTEKTSLSFDASFFNKRLQLSLDLYNSDEKNQVLMVPVASEYGYTGTLLSGMEINNKGIDVMLGGLLAKGTKFNWSGRFNVNVNRNELMALPQGRKEVVIGDRKLAVGKAIDQFWLLQNNGIYATMDEVPVSPDNKRFAYKNIPFSAGDPRWIDRNGDFVINDDDKVLEGNVMPKFTGGYFNQLSYKGWDLSFQLYFAIGQKAINYRAANQFNFINNESSNSINAVKEIYFWQDDINLDNYPLYNPWSNVNPYRADQDLFLEDASFLKLRSVTLGYHFSWKPIKKSTNPVAKKAYIYLTGSNLFTITNFSGSDPELIDFNGNYNGYSLPIPVSLMLGLRLDL